MSVISVRESQVRSRVGQISSVLTTVIYPRLHRPIIMAFSVGSPVNTALVLYIIYRVNSILFPSINPPAATPHDFRDGYSWMPKSHPPTMLYKAPTFRLPSSRHIYCPTLDVHPKDFVTIQRAERSENTSRHQWDRLRRQPWAQLLRARYAVAPSRGRSQLTPVQEGMYANFAGRDASRGMAKQSFDEGPFGHTGVIPC